MTADHGFEVAWALHRSDEQAGLDPGPTLTEHDRRRADVAIAVLLVELDPCTAAPGPATEAVWGQLVCCLANGHRGRHETDLGERGRVSWGKGGWTVMEKTYG